MIGMYNWEAEEKDTHMQSNMVYSGTTLVGW